MDSTERQRLFTSSIEKAVRANEEIVIFDDPASGKFIQFAVFASEKTLVIDIPTFPNRSTSGSPSTWRS